MGRSRMVMMRSDSMLAPSCMAGLYRHVFTTPSTTASLQRMRRLQHRRALYAPIGADLQLERARRTRCAISSGSAASIAEAFPPAVYRRRERPWHTRTRRGCFSWPGRARFPTPATRSASRPWTGPGRRYCRRRSERHKALRQATEVGPLGPIRHCRLVEQFQEQGELLVGQRHVLVAKRRAAAVEQLLGHQGKMAAARLGDH